MLAKVSGEAEEPDFGVLRGEGRERDEEEGDQRDGQSEVEPENERVRARRL